MIVPDPHSEGNGRTGSNVSAEGLRAHVGEFMVGMEAPTNGKFSANKGHGRNRWFLLLLVGLTFLITAGVAYVVIFHGKSWIDTVPDSKVIHSGTPNPNSASQNAREPIEINITGTFIAKKVTQISATVLARVSRIYVKEGDSVSRGQLLVGLATVDGENVISQLRFREEAQRHTAQKSDRDLDYSQHEVSRLQNLAGQGFISQKALEDGMLALESAKTQQRTAHAQAGEASAALAGELKRQTEFRIDAPFAGTVVALTAQIGEVVSPAGQTGSYVRSGLLTLLEPESMRVEVPLQERLLPKVMSTGCALVTSLAEPEMIKNEVYRIVDVGKVADRARGAVLLNLKAASPLVKTPILYSSAEVTFVAAGDIRCKQAKARTSNVPEDINIK